MGNGFIIRRGGGGNLKFFTALIDVTYPVGSTCTCSNGSKTLKAKGTSGKYLFNVEPGTWTVSCTDGTDTASQSVEITSAFQTANVALEYGFYLFKSGVGAVKALTYTKEANSSVTATADSIVFDYNTSQTNYICQGLRNTNLTDVDLTNFTYLKARAKVSNPATVGSDKIGLRLCVSNSKITAAGSWYDDFAASLVLGNSSSAKTYSLSVKSISGNKYVGLWGASKATVYDIWLE